MPKQVGDYILDCLRALNKDEGEVELGNRIHDVRQYWHDLWGGAVPSGARIVAAFLSNEPGSREPKDLWFFSDSHCLLAHNVMSAHLDLLVYPFRNGVHRLRVVRNYDDQPSPGSRLVVGLWFDEQTKVALEAGDGNCLPLETLLEEVLIPHLQ